MTASQNDGRIWLNRALMQSLHQPPLRRTLESRLDAPGVLDMCWLPSKSWVLGRVNLPSCQYQPAVIHTQSC